MFSRSPNSATSTPIRLTIPCLVLAFLQFSPAGKGPVSKIGPQESGHRRLGARFGRPRLLAASPLRLGLQYGPRDQQVIGSLKLRHGAADAPFQRVGAVADHAGDPLQVQVLQRAEAAIVEAE